MNYLVDDIGVVVNAMRAGVTFDSTFDISFKGKIPFYMYGHPVEINNRLINKTITGDKYNRYPLIALRMDFEEKVSGGMFNYNLNIAIVHKTEMKYTADQRYENIFKPILYPLYRSFMVQLRRAGFIWTGKQKYPPHTKIDRPYYGTPASQGNVKNIFSDPLDAIEILDLQISKPINFCTT